MPKLNIGAGEHPLDGWMNVDIGGHPGTLRMDASHLFPLPDNQFDRVFSEHTLEHLTYQGGQNMLCESFRILKPEGRIRISIPTTDFLLHIRYSDAKIVKRYIEWHCNLYNPGLPPLWELVWNNFYREWGHRFMYSMKLLRAELKAVGFVDFYECQIGESDDEEFKNLENSSRQPEGFLQLETYTIEAEKPNV